MNITFNGKAKQLAANTSIQELLDQLRLDCLQVVVEHNRNIVPRQRLAEVILNDGDTLEVIHFVGGG
ncbi:MAG: sulfur carrier protein ThiS [Desulfuromonadales bacterium]|nr:sulfur carrier protein ThiS [Desulfuromonadales bacterium]